MKTTIVLFGFCLGIGKLLRLDVERRQSVSKSSWIVFLWILILGSRPVSSWFGYDAGQGGVDAYVEGNPLERNIYLLLILLACRVLWRRQIDLGEIVNSNRWLIALYLYWLISVGWSDIPFVAFKRLFKDFGNVIMALVLLTEKDPPEAIRAVFVRAGYVLISLSVLFIRYFPDLGRTYSGYNKSDLMYIGVCTHKNTLGSLLLVCGLFLLWDIASGVIKINAREKSRKAIIGGLWVTSLMTAWLLQVAHSATSLFCTIVGVSVFLATRLQVLRKRFESIGIITIVCGVAFLLLDGFLRIREVIISMLGRDMTLTSRTDAWDIVVRYVDNPIIGTGFKSFWAGDRMRQIWETFVGVVQAHSGYIETYLNGGIIGLGILLGWLLWGFQKIKRDLLRDPDFGGICLAIFMVGILYNLSEAAYNQLSLIWLVTLIALISARPTKQRESLAVDSIGTGSVEAIPCNA